MRRALLVLLAIVVLVPVGGLVAARILLDEAGLKTRLAESVRRSTGRELAIGRLGWTWSLVPTVTAQDVTVSNPPGFSRPDLVRAERVEAEVALWPLLSRRVEIRRITLVRPDVQLERDAGGRPNWNVAPEGTPSTAGPSAPPSAPTPRFAVEVADVRIEDARLGWRSGAATLDAAVPGLRLSPGTGAVDGRIRINGVVLELKGTAGPQAGRAWPVKLTLVGGGIAAALSGTAGPDGDAEMLLLAPDAGALTQLAGRPLPPLRDVRVSARLSGAGLATIKLLAGESDLSNLWPGLRLTRLSATTASVTQPVQGAADGMLGGLPVTAGAVLGSLSGTGPVQASVTAGDATLAVQGAVTGAAFEGTVSLRIPDLARIGAAAGVALPPVQNAALDARVIPAPNGAGVQLRGLRLSALQGDVAGDLALGWGPRPSLRGSLVSQRLDLDAWTAPAAFVAPAAPPGSSAAPPPAPAPPERLVPDLPLPFATLRRADVDLTLAVAEALWRGVAYRAIQARVLLQDGKLRLDPMQVQGPGGVMSGQVQADANAVPPVLALTVRAPGLAAGPTLAVIGAPPDTTGTLDLDVQLRGAGATLRALVATLDGHAGLAMTDGEVDNAWLAGLLESVMRAARLPIEPGGRSKLRCLALRADVASGAVALRSLVLDTNRLQLDGGGGLNLADETLDLHLRPNLRIGGTGVAAPLRVGGTFRSPKPGLDPGVLSPGRVGIVIGGASPADACGPALALARDGRPGPVPAAEAPRPSRPADLLRSLLR